MSRTTLELIERELGPGRDLLEFFTVLAPPLALAPPAVVGLMNLRGQIVATIDLRARLRLPLRDGDAPVVVVVQTADGALGLAVDEIGDVIDVDPELCEPPPDTVRGPARPLVVAACKLDGRLLLTLDLDRVLELQTEFEESTVGRAAGATGR